MFVFEKVIDFPASALKQFCKLFLTNNFKTNNLYRRFDVTKALDKDVNILITIF